jgi:hypothetical protein
MLSVESRSLSHRLLASALSPVSTPLLPDKHGNIPPPLSNPGLLSITSLVVVILLVQAAHLACLAMHILQLLQASSSASPAFPLHACRSPLRTLELLVSLAVSKDPQGRTLLYIHPRRCMSHPLVTFRPSLALRDETHDHAWMIES